MRDMKLVNDGIRTKIYMQDESELSELLRTQVTMEIDHYIWECIDSSLLAAMDNAVHGFERELNE